MRGGMMLGPPGMPPDVEAAMVAQQRLYQMDNYRQTTAMSVAVGLATMDRRDGEKMNAMNIARQAKEVADALTEVMFPDIPEG